MNIINKRQKEKEVALFFKEYFNKTYNRRFDAKKDVSDEEADYLLLEDNEKIKLQITMSDHIVIESALEAIKRPNEVGELWDPNHIDCILRAVQEKSQNYPKEVQRELILLIYSDLAKFDPQYLKREIQNSCPENNFKEIYFVELPKQDPQKSYPLYEGNIIKLR